MTVVATNLEIGHEMTFTEAAAEVLRIAGKPLHYKEITELAIEKNLLSHVGKSPEVTMGARLAALLKKEDDDNPIVRVKPGVFALREWEGKIVFLHAIRPGSSEHSYGIAVARLAGVPEAVLKRAKQVLASVQTNGAHLLSLINDVLDISKIEAGELSLSLSDYSLRAVIETVVNATGSLAQAKGLRISTDITPDLPVGHGDERRLTQVLLNIVSNAIKFTDKGGVLDFYKGDHRPLFPDLTKDQFTYQMSDHLPLWIQINTDIDGAVLDQLIQRKRGG